MLESSPEYGPPVPPTIPEGVPGELRINENGLFFVRHEINERWVSYRTFDEEGYLRRGVAIPRFEVFTQEDIARFDAMFAAEDAARTPV